VSGVDVCAMLVTVVKKSSSSSSSSSSLLVTVHNELAASLDQPPTVQSLHTPGTQGCVLLHTSLPASVAQRTRLVLALAVE